MPAKSAYRYLKIKNYTCSEDVLVYCIWPFLDEGKACNFEMRGKVEQHLLCRKLGLKMNHINCYIGCFSCNCR